jgi:hypothetical protein
MIVTKFLVSAAVSAIALWSAPAAAQTVPAPQGGRVEAVVGYDALRVDLNDFGMTTS